MKTKRNIVILLSVVLIIAVAIILALNWNNWFGKTTPTDGDPASTTSTQELDPNAKDKDDTSNPTSADSGGIAIPGFKTLYLKAGTKTQKVSFENPKENNCYFVMTLILNDGTELYKSQLVEPGKGVYDIELSKALAAGSYEKCFLKYECFEMNAQQTPLNGANIDMTIEVK